TGNTKSTDFPITAGSFQTAQAGGPNFGDAFVTKLNAAGSSIDYSTFVGGAGDDRGQDIALDASGNAYITGSTGNIVAASNNFPTVNPIQATAPSSAFSGFVTKINATGTALVYSTFLGGSVFDGGIGIAVDSGGAAYVTGSTQSTNFPVVNAFQSTLSSAFIDAFITKINASGTTIDYSTYLGGSVADQGNDIVVDSSGNAYIAGQTGSTDFPVAAAFQSTFGGSSLDAFVSKIDPTQSGAASLLYSSYLGGSGSPQDRGLGIALDGTNHVYVTGQAGSSFPTVDPLPGVTSGSGFVTKVDPTGSALVYSTYVNGGISQGIAVDSVGDAYIVSQGNSVSKISSACSLVVTNTTDSGPGSLREAINCAVTTSGADIITFNIPTSDPGFDGSAFTITPATALPTVTDATTIDGASQAAFAGDTNSAGPEIVLDGSLAPTDIGVLIHGDDNGVNDIVVNGFGFGIYVLYASADQTPSRNEIHNNYVGTDSTGTIAVPNQFDGIVVQGFGSPSAQATDNIVQNNLVSGNLRDGIVLCDSAQTQIRNNRIGTDINGTNPLPNGEIGIQLVCAGDPRNVIENNVIAFNGGDGIRDVPDYRFPVSLTADGHQSNLIRNNSIHSNSGLGINLLPAPFGFVDAVTANDPNDSDTGGNNLQNFPDLSSATSDASSTTIAGNLNSTPNLTFEVEFFASSSCDPSGYGEGEVSIGTATIATDGSGNGAIAVTLPTSVPSGQFITATATDPDNNTSEFSACVEVLPPPTLTVTKVVINDDGGTKVVADFPLFVNSTSVNSGDVNVLAVGAYTVSETIDPDYGTTISGDCAADGTITLALGDAKSCTITNDDIAPLLTVTKVIINDDGGTKVVADFDLFVDAASVSSGVQNSFAAGTYIVNETTDPDYSTTFSGDCATDGTITLALGDVKSCTITNDDIAPSLTVTKIVINDNGGTKVIADFPLFVNGTLVNSGELNTFAVGVYTVSETIDPGYGATISGDCAADGTITLALGDVKSCTITNDDIAPSLTVTKIVINDDGGTKIVADFPLFVNGAPVNSGELNVLAAGVYTASETIDPGYEATISGDCAVDGTITLALGDVKSCTITNDDIAPLLTVTKVVINDDGGTKVVSDFELFVSGTPVTSGVQNSYIVGTYIVSETLDAGYAATFSGDCAATGSITLNPGDVKSCTITNDDLSQAVATCGGFDVLDSGSGFVAPSFPGNLIMGTSGPDIIHGTAAADLILGLQGPDDIYGKQGDDVICGGPGKDIILGQAGDDVLYGDEKADWLIGGAGNDILHGGPGWDDLEGNGGQDTLYGDQGYDVLLGGLGPDTIFGGDNQDYMEGNQQADTIDGGNGPDTAFGGAGNDTIAGNDGDDDLFGNGGNDDIDGGADTDLCKGGPGSDTIANCEGTSSASVALNHEEDHTDEAGDDFPSTSNPYALNDLDEENSTRGRTIQLFVPISIH
ncbi:MAG: SBBP repeat-containing protein, partial [Chloroflexota bacterium]